MSVKTEKARVLSTITSEDYNSGIEVAAKVDTTAAETSCSSKFSAGQPTPATNTSRCSRGETTSSVLSSTGTTQHLQNDDTMTAASARLSTYETTTSSGTPSISSSGQITSTYSTGNEAHQTKNPDTDASASVATSSSPPTSKTTITRSSNEKPTPSHSSSTWAIRGLPHDNATATTSTSASTWQSETMTSATTTNYSHTSDEQIESSAQLATPLHQLPNTKTSEYHTTAINAPTANDNVFRGPSLLAQEPLATVKQIPHVKAKQKKSAEKGNVSLSTGRKLFMMRHAERVDRAFPEWWKVAFDRQDHYRPYDLNQPLKLPKRAGGRVDFYNDCPITEMGYVCAQMAGRALRLTGLKLIALYTSPALRCIQTARGLLKTLGTKTKLRIEPGLFEWMGWYETIPNWFTLEECQTADYDVDHHYKPTLTYKQMRALSGETNLDHMKRMSAVVQRLVTTHREPGVILIIGHATTLDACARPLLGKQLKGLTKTEVGKIDARYPYCSIVAEQETTDGTWKLMENVIPPITYWDFNNRFDLQFFNR